MMQIVCNFLDSKKYFMQCILIVGLLTQSVMVPVQVQGEAVIPAPSVAHGPIAYSQGATFNLQFVPEVGEYKMFNWEFRIVGTIDGIEYVYNTYYRGGSDRLPPSSIVWNGYANWYTGATTYPASIVAPPGNYTIQLLLTYANFEYRNGVYIVNSEQQVVFTENIQITTEPEVEPGADPLSKLDPVLLIHGYTSYPENWQDAKNNSDYFSLLQAWGYPAEYIAAYHYSGVGVGRNGYNNQGDIPEMAAGMHDAVETLSQKSLAHGGDGMVDIVAHSMGGLIARQYFKDYPTGHHIDQVISIGTPYQGGLVKKIYEEAKYEKYLLGLVINTGLGLIDNPADLDSVSASQLTPGSSLLNSLNNIPYLPNVRYYTMYGEINLVINHTIFDFEVKSDSYDVGDVLVFPGSATLISDHQPATQIGYKQNSSYNAKLELGQIAGNAFALKAVVDDLFDWPYYHSNLTHQASIQQDIKEILNEQ